MAKTRKALIKQTDDLIKALHDVISAQLSIQKNADDPLTPQTKFKLHVLDAIFKNVDEFVTQSVRTKFEVDHKANDDLDKDKREEGGEILKNALAVLMAELHHQSGDQQGYITRASQAYLDSGNNIVSVNMSDIEKESKVYSTLLTLYGLLMRQKLCLEQIDEQGATQDFANGADAIKLALREGIKKIKPDEVARLENERKQFNKVFAELLNRISNNVNPRPFDEIEGHSPFAILVRKINAQLFNSLGKSRLPTNEYMAKLKSDAESAAENGQEAELLIQQQRAKAVSILITSIATNLGAALKEYNKAINRKVGDMEKGLNEDLEKSLNSESDILKMRYILTIADLMVNLQVDDPRRKEKSDFDFLTSNAKDLAMACAGVDGGLIGSDGWSGVGERLKKQLDSFVPSLKEFTGSFTSKRQQVEKVQEAFIGLKKAFDAQREAHHHFPNDLNESDRKWNKDEAPLYFNVNWLLKSAEILHMRPSGFRALINRHWGKVSTGGALFCAAAVLTAIFLLSWSWPFVIAAGVGGLVAGVVIVATGAKIGDVCCRVEPTLGEMTEADAGFILGADLSPNASSRTRSSSAENIRSLNTDEELADLDSISRQLRSVTLDDVVVAYDASSGHSASSSPRDGASSTASTSTLSYKPGS